MNHSIFRVRLAVAIAAGVSFAPVGVAFADHNGPPVGPNCVGTTMSTNVRAFPPGAVGAAISEFAQADDGRPGIGDGIQALQAGDVPDEIAPNTCNND